MSNSSNDLSILIKTILDKTSKTNIKTEVETLITNLQKKVGTINIKIGGTGLSQLISQINKISSSMQNIKTPNFNFDNKTKELSRFNMAIINAERNIEVTGRRVSTIKDELGKVTMEVTSATGYVEKYKYQWDSVSKMLIRINREQKDNVGTIDALQAKYKGLTDSLNKGKYGSFIDKSAMKSFEDSLKNVEVLDKKILNDLQNQFNQIKANAQAYKSIYDQGIGNQKKNYIQNGIKQLQLEQKERQKNEEDYIKQLRKSAEEKLKLNTKNNEAFANSLIKQRKQQEKDAQTQAKISNKDQLDTYNLKLKQQQEIENALLQTEIKRRQELEKIEQSQAKVINSTQNKNYTQSQKDEEARLKTQQQVNDTARKLAYEQEQNRLNVTTNTQKSIERLILGSNETIAEQQKRINSISANEYENVWKKAEQNVQKEKEKLRQKEIQDRVKLLQQEQKERQKLAQDNVKQLRKETEDKFKLNNTLQSQQMKFNSGLDRMVSGKTGQFIDPKELLNVKTLIKDLNSLDKVKLEKIRGEIAKLGQDAGLIFKQIDSQSKLSNNLKIKLPSLEGDLNKLPKGIKEVDEAFKKLERLKTLSNALDTKTKAGEIVDPKLLLALQKYELELNKATNEAKKYVNMLNTLEATKDKLDKGFNRMISGKTGKYVDPADITRIDSLIKSLDSLDKLKLNNIREEIAKIGQQAGQEFTKIKQIQSQLDTLGKHKIDLGIVKEDIKSMPKTSPYVAEVRKQYTEYIRYIRSLEKELNAGNILDSSKIIDIDKFKKNLNKALNELKNFNKDMKSQLDKLNIKQNRIIPIEAKLKLLPQEDDGVKSLFKKITALKDFINKSEISIKSGKLINEDQIRSVDSAIVKLRELQKTLTSTLTSNKQQKIFDFNIMTSELAMFKSEIEKMKSSLSVGGNVVNKSSIDEFGKLTLEIRNQAGYIEKLKFQWDSVSQSLRKVNIEQSQNNDALKTFKISSFKSIADISKNYKGFITKDEIKNLVDYIKNIEVLDAQTRKLANNRISNLSNKGKNNSEIQDLEHKLLLYKKIAEFESKNARTRYGSNIDKSALDAYLSGVSKLNSSTDNLKKKMKELDVEYRRIVSNARTAAAELNNSNKSFMELFRIAMQRFPKMNGEMVA